MRKRFTNNAGFLVLILSIISGLVLIISGFMNLVLLQKMNNIVNPISETISILLLLFGGVVIIGGIVASAILFSLAKIIELLEAERENMAEIERAEK